MNWSRVLRFRERVEEMIREELIRTEWERSQEAAKREALQREMQRIALELEKTLRAGVGKVFAMERFRWLDEIGQELEKQSDILARLEERILELNQKLKDAHHSRRVVEIVIARKETALKGKVAKQEQRLQDEIASRQFLNLVEVEQ